MIWFRMLGVVLISLFLATCGDNDSTDNTSSKGKATRISGETNPMALADRTALDPSQDPYLWLENVEGERALAWVEEQNALSLERLTSDPRFSALEDQALKRYNSKDKIAYGQFYGAAIHNFWQDDQSIRGIWRKTSDQAYLSGTPKWETILDFDALSEQESENWVYKGRNCLKDSGRCLINLSRGGGDAVVVREFDLESKSFVENGFFSPEAKQWTAWIDQDTLMIATDFGAGTMNSSGYPTQVRLWTRGSALSEAKILLEDKDAVFNFPGSSHRRDGVFHYIVQGPDFFTERFHWLKDGELVRLNLPTAMNFQGFFKGFMAIQLRKDWQAIKDKPAFPAGHMVLIKPDDALAERFERALVIGPDAGETIDSIALGAERILLSTLKDVTGRLMAVSFEDDGSINQRYLPLIENGNLRVAAADENSDRFLVNFESFLTPDSLYFIEANKAADIIYQLPDQFDAKGFITEQRFAVSSDGTQVPYFVIRDKEAPLDGSTPAMLYGYGGFEISLTPGYLAGFSSLWLEKGGTYVVANIRGGGEYGPLWHQAALKENRQRAYDDFIAVAEDMINQGITSKDRLGIRGGSNGGLLMGVMLTQRPDLFEAVICAVPLLDMYRFDKLLAGASWVGEYGDPDTDDWSFISQYSPYQNVFADVVYPEPFFYTSTKDDRVHPGHARKMAARMMEQGHNLLYYENTEGGHAAAANLKQRAYSDALQTVYALQKLKPDQK